MAEGQTAGQDSPLDGLNASRLEAGRPLRSRQQLGLHVCPSCASELVYPTDWEPASRKRWSVDLRCPDCEWLGNGVYAQEIVDRFDEVLDDGTEQLLDDLNLLARANMEEQVERFIAALRAGQILPEDF
jgi:hypothetical protein